MEEKVKLEILFDSKMPNNANEILVETYLSMNSD